MHDVKEYILLIQTQRLYFNRAYRVDYFTWHHVRVCSSRFSSTSDYSEYTYQSKTLLEYMPNNNGVFIDFMKQKLLIIQPDS